MDELRERAEEEEDERILQLLQLRSASAEFNRGLDQNKQQEQKSKISDLQRIRTTGSSRNTITPSSTPQMSYNDAVLDGLTMAKGKRKINYQSILSFWFL
jgi:DNA gyrase/topoisomerase IV subunit A